MGQSDRKASIQRNTKETKINITLNLDGTGVSNISTGIGFLDHMLEQFSRHSLIDLKVKAEGDLHIDFHHTTEDTGIAIGEALNTALGDRMGITRFGSAICPLDEALTRAVVDCSNRPYLIWKVGFSTAKLGDCVSNIFILIPSSKKRKISISSIFSIILLRPNWRNDLSSSKE